MQGSAEQLLLGLFRTHRGRILLTYGLVLAEETLELLYPLVIGLAINDLLRGSSSGLWWFLAQYLTHLLIATTRRMYDTRTYTRIYADLASDTVLAQHRQRVELSQVAARSSLVREFVEFFELDVPYVLKSLYSVIGALVMLAIYDPRLAGLALLVFVPVTLVNRYYLLLSHRLNRGLNNQLEREVGVIKTGEPRRVRKHYKLLAFWRIKLSDAEALNYGTVHLFMMALMGLILYRTASTGQLQAGDIFAVVSYGLSFTEGLDSVPMLIQQISRLRDIGQRVNSNNPS